MRNRSFKNSTTFIRLLALAVAFFAVAGVASAQSQSTLEKRVSAIPAARLLHDAPSALVDPNRQIAAEHLIRYTRPAWFVYEALQLGVLLWLWRSGNAARLREFIRRWVPSRLATRFVFGAALALILQLATLPASFFDYRVYRVFGLSTQLFPSWIRDVAVSTALEMLVIGAIVAGVLWLVEATRLWWIYTIVSVFAISLFLSFVYPLVVEPLFYRFTPFPVQKPLGLRIEDLAARAGQGHPPIYISNMSSRTREGNAYLVGIGPSKRIVVGDTLLAGSSGDEVVFILAHELGHAVHHDTLKGSFFGAIIFIFAAALSVLIADRIGFRRDDDPLSRLALVGALLICMDLIFMPLINGYSRSVEHNADAFALQMTNDRVAGARTFVRFADEDIAPLCPAKLARLYWYTHPPLGSRIAFVQGTPDPCP